MFQRFFLLSFITLTVFGAAVPRIGAVNYDPKSLQRGLFESNEFTRVRRNARADRINKDVHYKPSSSSSSSVTSSVSSLSTSEKEGEVRYEDLSSTERDTLRTQLRARACPAKAHEGYRQLCERLLKLQPKRSVQQGILTDKVLER